MYKTNFNETSTIFEKIQKLPLDSSVFGCSGEDFDELHSVKYSEFLNFGI